MEVRYIRKYKMLKNKSNNNKNNYAMCKRQISG